MAEEVKKPKKLKFLFVSSIALIGDLAWQIKKEGHEVKYYIDKKSEKDVADGFVDKCEDWKTEKEWADIIVFDDTGFGAVAEALRKEGKPVIGGSTYTDKLEEDRDFGQEELKKVGVSTLPQWNFTDFDEAIAFIKKNPGRYVIKPSGDAQNEKELTYIGQEEDGADLINILGLYKKSWSKKIHSFQFQKFAQGVEVAIGAFFNGKDFILPIHINFEHKKMFPGDLGPSCYSEDTEILTDGGWKTFDNVMYADKVLSFNKESKELVWEYPRKIYWMKYSGEMINFKNRYVDLLVTPNHRMLTILKSHFYKNQGKFRVINAEKMYSSGENVILQASVFSGSNPEFFELPEYRDGRKYIHLEKQVNIEDWAAFMGWYLSEGYCTKDSVYICQSKTSKYISEIPAILSKLPFAFTAVKKGFKIYSVQLANYLKQFGCAGNKYVPAYLKNGNKDIILSFLENFNKGDGDLHASQRRYHSSSYCLISDLQEMLLKIGAASTITKDTRIETIFPSGKKYKHGPGYSLEERKNNYVAIRKNNKFKIKYDGFVGCVQTPSSFVVVRRNGRICISGNTGEMGTTSFFSMPNVLFGETMHKMKAQLAVSGYVGYIDLNCIANARGIYPLEFTSRFGYPTISLQIEGVTDDWGEFLYAIAKGEKPDLKTKKGFQICVVVAVPPFPFIDAAAFKKYSEDATVLFKKPVYDGVHLGDVKLVEGDWRLAGQSGYALILTGSGSTMEEARKQVYRRVENIMIPNMFYRTDIGERWIRDGDLLHTWAYV